MKSNDAHMDIVSRYLSGQATSEEVTQLEALMLEDPQLRTDFLACARVDAALPGAIGKKITAAEFAGGPTEKAETKIHWFRWAPTAAAAAIMLATVVGGLKWWSGSPNDPETSSVVARFGDLQDCRWTDSATRVASGDIIATGQRIELSAGSAELIFNTGARLKLLGPAIVEPRSDNSVFLTLGQVNLVAETPESKGFTVITPSSTFVDVSTAFTAAVSPDGLSRLQVTDGEVDVVLDGIEHRRRLKRGQTLYVEPGDRQIITRIEPGDETPAFRFPTIEPPSAEDYADQAFAHATIRVTAGALKTQGKKSGPATVLLDGKGQPRQDAPFHSAFFDRKGNGSFLVDLGQAISITKINSYSWHQHDEIVEHRERAQQVFALYGYAGNEIPDLTHSPQEAGWTRIARVNSDRFFNVNDRLDRPAQQASSITAADGNIGSYRYLLWETRKQTFYGEIDVFGGAP